MFKRKKEKNSLILVILVAVASGLVAGVAVNYIFATLPFFGNVNISDLNPDRQIVIEDPRNVVIEQDRQIEQIENNILPTLVNIYNIKNVSSDLQAAYLPSEILGQGFVLTADGWIVTPRDSIKNLKGKYIVVGYQGKQYEISNFIEDKSTGMVYGKIDARGLPVIHMGDSNDVAKGQTMIVIRDRKITEVANVTHIGYDFAARLDLIQSSEDLDKQLFLDIALDGSYNGAVVTNFKGEMMGIIKDSRVVLVNYLKTTVNQVLDGEEVTRPILGIKYIDLAQVEGLIVKGDKGALVYADPVETSPAFGLLTKGEIIKKVNDIELNDDSGLAEALIKYKTGDKIDLLVLREGEDVVVEVELR